MWRIWVGCDIIMFSLCPLTFANTLPIPYVGGVGHYPCILWEKQTNWSGVLSLCSLKSAATPLLPYWVGWTLSVCSLKFAAHLLVPCWVGWNIIPVLFEVSLKWDIIPVFFEVCCHAACAVIGEVEHYTCVLWSLLPLFLCCIYLGRDIIPRFFEVCCNSACAVLGEVGHYPCSLKFAATLSVLYWVGWDIIPVFFEACCHSFCAVFMWGGTFSLCSVKWDIIPVFFEACCSSSCVLFIWDGTLSPCP